MVFSSITFLLYFLPISLLGYYLMSFSRKIQNVWLLLVSLVFYAWGEPVFVFILMGSVVVNWISGLIIHANKSREKVKKVTLAICCALNLLLLGVFKYTNFIVDTVYGFIGWEPLTKVPEIALPIGISFFTFQAMSYVIDVYRNDAKVQKNLLYLGLYVAFFPQLVAGPIVRYSSIAEQIEERKTTFSMFSDGCTRFAIGMIKKIIISNNMAVIVDNIFELTNAGSDVIPIPALLAWTSSIAYCLQLYYDFSGYSDMAIGLGKMFGFEFEENFEHPFMSKSIREFMSRWHISLAKWFSQYVYRPLGGSRMRNDDLMVRNLFIVWLLTGVWHGAAWTFIIWGLGFFALIVLEKATAWEKWRIPEFFKHAVPLLAVMFMFILFRAENMGQFFEICKNMFGLNNNGFFSDTALMIWKEYGLVFAMGIAFLFPIRAYFEKKITMKTTPAALRVIGGSTYVVILLGFFAFCVVVLAKGGYNPFIYFNF